MITNLYSVHDKTGEEYLRIYQAKSDTVAMRMFLRMLIDERRDPKWYDIYRLGTFDDEKGVLVAQKVNLKEVVIENEELSELDKKLEEIKEKDGR